MTLSILVVENDQETQLIVANLLRGEGYEVTVSAKGGEGSKLAIARRFDLLVSAVNLPELNGFDLCKSVRQNGFDGGVLMLTTRTSVDDRVNGLRSGADDYLAKPFEPRELLARVAALLRRLGKVEPGPLTQYRFGDVSVEFEHGRVLRKGKPVSLASKEMQLLRRLIDHRGEVVSRANLMAEIWPEQPFISANTLDVHVAWLRRKLEENPQKPQFIVTVRGRGYRFEPSLHVLRTSKELDGADLARASDRETELLSAAVRTMQEPAMAVDESASISFANRAACDLLGYSREELLSLNISDIDAGSAAAHWDKTWSNLKRQGSIAFETSFRTRDGRILPTEVSSHRFQHGNRSFALTLVRDSTDRGSIEQSLRQSQRMLRSLVDAVPNSISRFDLEGRRIFLNPAVSKIFGVPPEHLLGKTLLEVSVPSDAAENARLAAQIQTAISERAPNATESTWNTAQGARVFRVMYIPEIDENGNVAGVLSFAHDITADRASRSTIRKLRRKLRLIAECKQGIMRATDEKTMLECVCNAICIRAGYRFAWIGYAENDTKKTIRAMAWSGFEDGYLEAVNHSWNDGGRGQYPAGYAIRSRQSSVCGDFSSDPKSALAFEKATRRGYRSCLALPLIDGREKSFGALTVYSGKVQAFPLDEIRMFESIAADLALGIRLIRNRKISTAL
jgi:PAS domain S-box-containing protein